MKESRNRKPLRENPLAPWELRLGKYRVFYRVEEQDVVVGAIGVKEHNKLFIHGEEHPLWRPLTCLKRSCRLTN